jgi:hypothetical protein
MSESVGRFAGFGIEDEVEPLPYLVERLMPAVYRRVSVPWGMNRDDLIAFASDRSVKTRRRICLVFEPSDCVYVEPDGSAEDSSTPPSGGIAIE